MARYVQMLDGSEGGCLLPPRTKPEEGVLGRHFHLRGVRGVEYTEGTKRDRPHAAVGGRASTAPYRPKCLGMNQVGPKKRVQTATSYLSPAVLITCCGLGPGRRGNSLKVTRLTVMSLVRSLSQV
jgi:hypothetical protein